MKSLKSSERKKNNLNLIMIIFAGLGMLTSVYLVIHEVQLPGFCPHFLYLPACYIVLGAYSLILLSFLLKGVYVSRGLFFIGWLLGAVTGVYFSINQILGYKECPIIFHVPIPLCYVSLGVFLLIMILKTISDKSLIPID